MKIKDEKIAIRHEPIHEDGTPVEPEEQPAARVIESEVEASERGGQVIGALPAQVIIEGTAGAIAAQMRKLCASCVHFKRARWQKFVRAHDSLTASLADRELINSVRGQLLMTGNAEVTEMHVTDHPENDFDVEHALMSLGFCEALTEHKKEQIVVHPLSSCPIEVASPERPDGFYKVRNRDAEREMSVAYDNIMQTAAGKK